MICMYTYGVIVILLVYEINKYRSLWIIYSVGERYYFPFYMVLYNTHRDFIFIPVIRVRLYLTNVKYGFTKSTRIDTNCLDKDGVIGIIDFSRAQFSQQNEA